MKHYRWEISTAMANSLRNQCFIGVAVKTVGVAKRTDDPLEMRVGDCSASSRSLPSQQGRWDHDNRAAHLGHDTHTHTKGELAGKVGCCCWLFFTKKKVWWRGEGRMKKNFYFHLFSFDIHIFSLFFIRVANNTVANIDLDYSNG